ncbi:MAG TPA: YggT family protein [Gemmatimonadales bacterium]|nr:YggT family protein [Gemmatimonadales bacterium]
MFLDALDIAVRSIVLFALAFAAIVALTHWAVRSRRIDPFGAWPRLVRRVSDPILLPLERRIIRAGGGPQNAPLWLLGLVIGCGLLLLSLTQWLIGTAAGLVLLAHGGPRVWLRVLLSAVFTILMAAILIRVIASWLGIGEYRKWMRPVYALTNWLIDPIRRILPPVGIFDFSPLVAWLVLYVVRGFVLGLL